MISEIPARRRRGGQPGNQNAKGNCGNKSARGARGNRGGLGAPLFNQFARKRQTLDVLLLREFKNCPEALAWIRDNAAELHGIEIPGDNDPASNSFRSLTLDKLQQEGQEFRRGLFCSDD